MVSRSRSCADCDRLLAGLPPGRSQALAEMADAARMDPSPAGRLHRAMETLAHLLRVDRASLLLPMGSSALSVAASSDAVDTGDLVLSLERYPELGPVLAGGEPVLVEDVDRSPLLADQLPAIRRAGVVSLAAVPFESGGARGVLRVTSRSRRLEAADVAALRAAAHLLGHVMAEPPSADTEGPVWLELLLRLADGVLVTGPDGTVRRALGAWHRLGLEAAWMVGEAFEHLVEPEEAQEARTEALLVLQGGRPRRPARFRLRTPAGPGPAVAVWAVRRAGGHGLLLAVRREDTGAPSPLDPAALVRRLPGLVLLAGPGGEIRAVSPGLAGRFGGRIPEGRSLETVLTTGPNGERRLALGGSRDLPVEVEDGVMGDGSRILLLHERRREERTPREERLRRTIARNLEELDELNRRLEAMDSERARFLAWSAHELKTPLTVIQSHLEILLDDLAEGLNEEQLAFLRIAHESSRRMRRMVLDLTDLAALQSGRLHLEIERVPLGDTMEGVAREMRPAADAAGVELEVVPTGAAVRADRGRLEQILRNLLDNAIRFTPEGGRVELAAVIEAAQAAVQVADTGIGIPPDQLDTVFEPFVQAERPPEGRAKGSGLGLFVCRRIALALGGRIEAAARPGGGSVFTLRLPLWPEGSEAP